MKTNWLGKIQSYLRKLASKMKNLQNKPQANEDDYARKIAGKIVDWQMKNEFLKKEISKLESGKDFPIFSLATFLLKTQLIEFELKQLITSLDQHLYFSTTSKILKRKIRTPKELDDKWMTLGKLKNEIDNYEGSFLAKLQKNLPVLVKLRNDFVHKLFYPGTIDELIKKSEHGLKIANNIIADIESVEKYLKENDPLK